jgi:purine-binding chemotaxis protein CheW
MATALHSDRDIGSIDIIAFRLGEKAFCVRTNSVREIRGWTQCTPIPQSPDDVMGVINLRGSVIPVIDLSRKLGMAAIVACERSAIIVVEVVDTVIGLLVDGVSDMLNVTRDEICPLPAIIDTNTAPYAEGIVTLGDGMSCFLDLEAIFRNAQTIPVE